MPREPLDDYNEMTMNAVLKTEPKTEPKTKKKSGGQRRIATVEGEAEAVPRVDRPDCAIERGMGGVSAAGLIVRCIGADGLHFSLGGRHGGFPCLFGAACVFSFTHGQETIQPVDIDRGIAGDTFDHLDESDDFGWRRDGGEVGHARSSNCSRRSATASALVAP